MKNQWTLGLSTFVIFCLLGACAQNNNDKGKRTPETERAANAEKTGGTIMPAEQNNEKVLKDSRAASARKFDISKLKPKALEPSEECKPFADLTLTQNESSTLKDFVDGKSGHWLLANREIYIEAESNDGKGSVEKIQMTGQATPSLGSAKPGEDFQDQSSVTCHTYKGSSLKDKDLIKLMSLAPKIPTSIDRQSGAISVMRIDFFSLKEDGARSAARLVMAEEKDAKTLNLLKNFSGAFKQTVEFKELEKGGGRQAILTIKTRAPVDANHTRTVITRATFVAADDNH